MTYTWILFDADGTLFDYEKAEASALAQTFEQFGHGFDAAYLGAYQRINEQIWRDYEQGKIAQERLKIRRFELLFEAIALAPTPDAAAFSTCYLSNLGNCAELLDGAETVINALRGKLHLGLITNGLKAVQRARLAQTSIGNAFKAIVISEEIGAAKPDTAIFNAAFALMDHPRKDEVLIVGDSLTSDMRGGSEYGIDTCWYNPKGEPRPEDITLTYEIHSLDGVLSIIGGNDEA